jgi:hypothetical protein
LYLAAQTVLYRIRLSVADAADALRAAQAR